MMDKVLPRSLSQKIKSQKGKGAQSTFEVLRKRILRLELKPGEKLDEATLSRAMGISRTPIREAMVRLSAEGLITLLPNHGAQVAPLDLMGIAQFFEAYDLVQRTAAHWAAARRTAADIDSIRVAKLQFDKAALSGDITTAVDANHSFHSTIAAAGRNGYIESTLRRLSEHGMRLCWVWYREYSVEQVKKDLVKSCGEHDQIFSAIESGRPQSAEQYAHEHTESFKRRVKDYLDSSFAPAIAIK